MDYNTPAPGDTFNLRVIQEEAGAVVATEAFTHLSLDYTSSRFAPAFVSQSSALIDLPGYCLARLIGAGVASATWCGRDTLAEEARFFSHRRATLGGGGPIGHQLSAIALPGG